MVSLKVASWVLPNLPIIIIITFTRGHCFKKKLSANIAKIILFCFVCFVFFKQSGISRPEFPSRPSDISQWYFSRFKRLLFGNDLSNFPTIAINILRDIACCSHSIHDCLFSRPFGRKFICTNITNSFSSIIMLLLLIPIIYID